MATSPESRPDTETHEPGPFQFLADDAETMALVEQLLERGKAVDPDRPETREAFETLIDSLDGQRRAESLFRDHPIYGATLIGVIRSVIGPAVGGKPLEMRRVGRGVGDRSGKRRN